MKAACTIVSPNYLHFARTLATSYRQNHPGHQFFVLVVADVTDRNLFKDEEFTAVLLEDLRLPDLRKIAMKYEILELNTNVKPSFMKYLLASFQLTELSYLDPDICLYRPMEPVFDALESASIVLTPHLTSPVPLDGLIPGEQDMLYNGTYNLGFIAVRADQQALQMLDWWEERCLKQGFSEARTGLFVDQKWINLAPGYFPGVKILRHLGCNMAYWNLHERILTRCESELTVNESVPLYFYHFSGVVLDDGSNTLSVHTNRFTLSERADLQQLFADYRARVTANQISSVRSLPYGFDHFSDGSTVTLLARRIYAKHRDLQVDRDPFDASSNLYRFCKRHGLLSGTRKTKKSTWREFDPDDRRVRAVNAALKLALRILGPDRYTLLMRYLSYIAVLRNQAIFIRD